MSARVFIGIGSNLDDPERQVLRALDALRELPQSRFVTSSSLYRSSPMGPRDQPDYINAVAEVLTELTAPELLAALQAIERAQGRDRTNSVRWGPRPLDLDIILFGMQQIHEPHLMIPHPGMGERAFVLYPLAELAPELAVPGLGNLSELLAQCPREGLQQMELASR